VAECSTAAVKMAERTINRKEPIMESFDSIADFLRARLSGTNVTAVARATGLNQPPLWRFLNGGAVNLPTAERLLAHFGCVVLQGTTVIRPSADAPTRQQDSTPGKAMRGKRPSTKATRRKRPRRGDM
jgi:hypothetical protein